MDRLRGAFTFHEAPEGMGTVEALDVGGETPRHIHERLVVGLVDAGARLFSLPTGTVRAGTGDVFVLPPGLPHACASFGGNGAASSYRLLCLPPGRLRTAAAAVAPAGARLRADFARAFRAVASRTPGAAERVNDLLRGLTVLFPPAPSGEGGSTGRESPVRMARRFITEHAGEPLVMEDVALAVGLSPFHLHRLFVAQTGLTPREFRETVRLRLARLSLEQGLSPAEAAVSAGFYDQSHLCRTFRRHMGCTPGAYASARSPGTKKCAVGVDGRPWKG